jgi:hypothetical protein
MVRRSFTAVIERNATFSADFETEPYESGWAIEALWFINVLEMHGASPTLTLQGQISPDGLCWCDALAPSIQIDQPGLYSLPMTNFGNWLRVTGSVRGEGAAGRVIIYLALKG